MRASHVILVLATLALIIYGRVVSFDFQVLDDRINILENPLLNPVTADHLKALWSSGYDQLYIPVTHTLWAALLLVSGALHGLLSQALIFHAANLFVHLLNACLLYSLLMRLPGESRDRKPVAALCAALFLCHPIQVEAVAWVTGMRDLLAAGFSLAALLLALETPRAASARNRLMLQGGATLAFASATLAKPGAVTLPLVLAGQWLLLEKRPRGLLPMAALWAGIAAAVVFYTRSLQPGYQDLIVPYWQRPVEVLSNLSAYLRAVLAFKPLTVAPRLTFAAVRAQPGFWAWCSAGAAALVTLPLLFRRQPVVLFGALVVTAAILPTSGIFAFHSQAWSDTADRYFYFAMAGVAMIVAGLLHQASGWLPKLAVTAFIVAAAWSSSSRLPVWRNDLTLSEAMARTNPGNDGFQRDYGVALLSAGHPEEGLDRLRLAARLRPDSLDHWKNIEHALAYLGHDAELLSLYQDRLGGDPSDALALFGEGHLLLLLGKEQDGIAKLKAALIAAPELARERYRPGEFLLAAFPQRFGAMEALARARKALPQIESLARLLKLAELIKRYPGLVREPGLMIHPSGSAHAW